LVEVSKGKNEPSEKKTINAICKKSALIETAIFCLVTQSINLLISNDHAFFLHVLPENSKH